MCTITMKEMPARPYAYTSVLYVGFTLGQRLRRMLIPALMRDVKLMQV